MALAASLESDTLSDSRRWGDGDRVGYLPEEGKGRDCLEHERPIPEPRTTRRALRPEESRPPKDLRRLAGELESGNSFM